MRSRWSAGVYATQTGAAILPLQVISASWGRGDSRGRRALVQLHEKFTTEQWFELLLKFWDRMIVFFFDDEPVYAGLIINAPAFDEHTLRITLEYRDIPGLALPTRWMHGVGGYSPASTFSVSGVSLAGALNLVLRRAYLTAVALPSWPYPIDFPAVETGSFQRTWPYYQYRNAYQMVEELTGMEGGPQHDLQPKRVGENIRFDQRIATTLTGPGFLINTAAEKSAAASVGYGLYGEATRTGIHFVGKGGEAAIRWGFAALPVSAGIARDDIYWDKDDPDPASLSAKARGRLAPRTGPTEQRPIIAKTSMISPAALRVGSPITILSKAKIIVPEMRTYPVVGWSGEYGAETYTITVQEQQAT